MKLNLLLKVFIITLVLFASLFVFNNFMVMPSLKEKVAIKKFYGNLSTINTAQDIKKIQNYTITKIIHQDTEIDKIDIENVFELKKGLCFHRSLILQKVLLMNNIRVRPVFLFANNNKLKTSYFDLFSNKINSHNIFEFQWKGNWYVMNTNTYMVSFMNLEEYLNRQTFWKGEVLYIRYLNNRNGRFISPSFLPDIYGF